MRCRPQDIIRTSEMRQVRNYRNGDTEDIITTILRMDNEADRYVNKEAAQCLRGNGDYETMRNVWKFVKSNVKYRTDRQVKEVVKSPAALFNLKSGDCKSFSISEAALLRALGFKGIRYRFASYGNSKEVTHVYIVAKMRGEDVILDAVHSQFDDEVQYTWKKDIPAVTGGKVSGIHGPVQNYSFMQLVGLGLLAWAIFR